jgi:hypothetical protein
MPPSRYFVIGTATYDAEATQTMVLDAWWHVAMVPDTTRHAGALHRRLMRLRRQVAINHERSHRTRFTIDNNADNNPRRHRWTQDDTTYREIR